MLRDGSSSDESVVLWWTLLSPRGEAVAPLVGCHPTTLLRAIERGELPASGRPATVTIRIRREALEEWLRPLKTTQEETP